MPNAVLHCHLAGRVLRQWRESPAPPPFPDTPATRNAFLHGAVGPDMGYFPGGDALLSRLAHHAGSTALTRALVAEARTGEERAFAWGWLTHVLADIRIHPLVNEAAGEQVTGARGNPLSPDAAPALHVGVEIGLDAFTCIRSPELKQLRLTPAFGPAGVRFLARAYGRTYGAAPSASTLLATHQAVCRLAAPLFTLNRAAARVFHLRRSGALPRLLSAGLALPLSVLRAACPRGSHAEGFFAPVHPPEWLIAAVDDVADDFARDFLGHVGTGLALLADHDLDTGQPSPAGSERARLSVEELRARAGRRTTSRPPSPPPGSTPRIHRPSAAPAA